MQIKDLIVNAQEKGKEKGLKGRRYRRFVEREFNKKAKKVIRIGSSEFKLVWGEKGVKSVQVVPRHKVGSGPPVRNVQKADPKGQAISSSARGQPAESDTAQPVQEVRLPNPPAVP